MRTGRSPLEWGTHGKITTRTVASGHLRASARVRLWDGELQRMTATAGTAFDARALLQSRIAERLRLSELDAWRYLTPDDPFDELVYLWLGDLEWDSDVSMLTRARCEGIIRRQLVPTFGDLTIGEITAERIEQQLTLQRTASEAALASSCEVLEILLDFAVGEGVIISNPMKVSRRDETPGRPVDLSSHREVVRGRIEHRRVERLREGDRPTTEVARDVVSRNAPASLEVDEDGSGRMIR